MIYKKNQNAVMLMASGKRAERFATSRGTIKAWAWQRVSPRITRILQ